MDMYTDEEVRAVLKHVVARYASISVCAQALGVDRTYLWRVVHGHRPVGALLAQKLGYVPVHAYTKDAVTVTTTHRDVL